MLRLTGACGVIMSDVCMLNSVGLCYSRSIDRRLHFLFIKFGNPLSKLS